MNGSPETYDCLIIGAGPGGLQAAIHLSRYNRRVVLLDRRGGSTKSAVRIENFLTQKAISGQEIIALGLEQATRFGTRVEKETVTRVVPGPPFQVHTGEHTFQARYVVVSSGVRLHFPRIKNMHRFFGRDLFTCVDCDGYQTTGKKLIIAGNSAETVRLALAMKQMFTQEITILLVDHTLPEDLQELLREEEIALETGAPEECLGEDRLTGIRLANGRILPCEAALVGFGYTLNDDFLDNLDLKRDTSGNILTNTAGESSLPGLFAVGALRPGNPQVVIAAGQGAAAAIEINKQLLGI